MLVYCFIVNVFNIRDITIPVKPIEEFAKELGDDIPNYVPFQGLKGIYGFVVDSNIDVVKLCEKYNYDIGNLYKKEILDTWYNKNHTIFLSYSPISTHPIFEFYKNQDLP